MVLYYIKIKNFHLLNDSIQKIKSKPQNSWKYLQVMTDNSHPETIKNSLN